MKVKSLILHSDLVADEMTAFVPRRAVIEGAHAFVLSSLIAYRIGNGGPNGLVNPNMEIWMPISPKYALVLLKDSDGRIPDRVVESRDHVSQINEFAMRKSGHVASHCDRLLKSLLPHGGVLGSRDRQISE